ncbi:GntR family transcriptional regulator [Bacillus horti]|uniref:DNA-binding transcriptional regulator YhcF (GntR family) n=1 Tax=Caldalkalibacillus horti TaxID=77523 RepID=A0ABT9W189_9BACI|nr:GntR family transcriptional regulator [Bacillus horti]MDQ0167032.1 DNA-binding transcriptional regulator YhcF (GntR family) [Bacillus horti]
MLIHINPQLETPIYTQLANQIIEGIATGRLAPAEELPSVRSLAADLGINLHTVNKAYNYLKQEGFLQVHRQKGAIVSPTPMPAADEFYYQKLHEQLRPMVAESICRQVDEEEFLKLCRSLYQELVTQKEE